MQQEKRFHAVVATEYSTIKDNIGEDYWIIFLIERGATDAQIKERYSEIYRKLNNNDDNELADYVLVDPKIAPRLVRQDWASSGDSFEYSARSQEILNITNYEVDTSYTATIEEIKEFQKHFKCSLTFEIEEMINGIDQ